MLYGTVAAYGVACPDPEALRRLARTEIPGIGEIGYIGLTAFVLNVVVTVVLTFVLRALKAPDGVDETTPVRLHGGRGRPGRQGGAAAGHGGRRPLSRTVRPQVPLPGCRRDSRGAWRSAAWPVGRTRSLAPARRMHALDSHSARRGPGRHAAEVRPIRVPARMLVRGRAPVREGCGIAGTAPLLAESHSDTSVAAPTDTTCGGAARPSPRCMLMLAVAAGESGANPELSRNGVHVRALVPASPSSPRTCRQRARPTGPGAETSGPRGWAGGRASVPVTRARVPPPAPAGPVPSEGEHHVTIAPADPASATASSPSETDGPGTALLRTLTELTADLPDTDPGRVAAAALRGRSAPGRTRRSCASWPPRRPPA